MGGADKKLVVVFEEERPVGCIELGLRTFRFDGIVSVDLSRRDLSARELAARRHGRRGFLEGRGARDHDPDKLELPFPLPTPTWG